MITSHHYNACSLKYETCSFSSTLSGATILSWKVKDQDILFVRYIYLVSSLYLYLSLSLPLSLSLSLVILYWTVTCMNYHLICITLNFAARKLYLTTKRLFVEAFHLCFVSFKELIIPPANEVAGVYSDPYVRPSVRSSVRPSLPISNPLLL